VLGFGFSFPVDHHTLDSGTLIQWTKGFENPGAVGEDPAKLLREAFHRQARPSGVCRGLRHVPVTHRERLLCQASVPACALVIVHKSSALVSVYM